MVIEGVDYAFSRPDISELARLGKKFACRYISISSNGPWPQYRNAKAITRSELATLHAAGLDVVINWEFRTTDSTEAVDDYAHGQANARLALPMLAELGAPRGIAVVVSVDQDITAGTMSQAMSYLRGWKSVLDQAGFRLGVYGEYDVVKTAFDQGIVKIGWQTYAWSSGKWEPRAQIQQYRNGVQLAGGTLDLDRAVTSDFGQWRANQEDIMGALDEHVVISTDIAALTGGYVAAGAKIPLGRFLQLIFWTNHNDYGTGLAVKNTLTALSAKIDTISKAVVDLKSVLDTAGGDPNFAAFVTKVEEEANKTRLFAADLIAKDQEAESKRAEALAAAWAASVVE